MANQTLLNIVQSATLPNTWESSCISILNSSSTFNWANGLVDGHGHAVSKLTNLTWGITVDTCYNFCNANKIPFNFNFQSFASSVTNYFLPWLALTAQLPYETGDPWNNIMSFCLAVGSPTLVTYSLAITILNRWWVRKTFDGLRRKAQSPSVSKRYNGYEQRIRAARFLLQEAQQVPLRASQEQGWLSSLIVIPDNGEWWSDLEKRLRSTRRGVTASLVAQMTFAAVAYLFTVIAPFDAELGDPTTALQIASGSLWIWLIPVIAGWITVGTQSTHHSIEDALEDNPGAFRALEPLIQQGADYFEFKSQRGLVVRPGLNPQPHRNQTAIGGLDAPDLNHLTIPYWGWFSVGGDEEKKGPVYNYSKLLTWWQLASSIDTALFQTLDGVSRGQPCQSSHQPTAPRWDTRGPPGDNLLGDIYGTSKYAGLDARRLLAYPKWSDVPPQIYKRIAAALGIALFLQWGTTGASILVAYLTPTIGLGCRSASYLFYGGLATISCFCLIASMLMSHEVMLRYQAVHVDNPSMDFRLRSRTNPGNPNQYARTWAHGALCGTAVILRLVGKFLAVANALWLIVSSLLEFTGGFDNCWCKGNAFGMANRGWVVLFKDAADLSAAARLPWGGGLAMTLIVCFAIYTFFFFGSLKTDDG